MKFSKMICAGLVFLGLAVGAQASPVDVSFTTSGTSGNYVLDFTVSNNLDANSSVYFFGVALGAHDVVGSPGSFNPDSWYNWGYNSWYGGSSTNYDNVWIGGNIASGSSLSGFQAHVTSLIAPTEVNWFAFAYGGNWTGGGNFNSGWNPGFEGVAGQSSSVPEPSALLLFGLGALGLGLSRRRK